VPKVLYAAPGQDKARFLLYADAAEEWIATRNELPADVFAKASLLQPRHNELSVWLFDDGDRELAVRIISAIQMKCDSALEVVPYYVFEIPSGHAITLELDPGDTFDDGINDRHRNLSDLSGRQLHDLLLELFRSGTQDTALKTELLGAVNNAVVAGRVDRTALPPRLRQQFNQHYPPNGV
jgi:hypothetical protein